LALISQDETEESSVISVLSVVQSGIAQVHHRVVSPQAGFQQEETFKKVSGEVTESTEKNHRVSSGVGGRLKYSDRKK
jgi:hypothetical protein